MREWAVLLFAGFLLFLLVIGFALRMRTGFSQPGQQEIAAPRPAAADPNRYAHLKTIVGKDGVPMAMIPAGKFLMGTKEEVGEFDERPPREVTLKGYAIDLYEVSRESYLKFVEATRHRDPEVMVFFDNPKKLEASPRQPVVGVSWDDANAYCRWAGKRLPTEAQWERAARGEDGRRYPWGEEFLEGHTNVRGGEDGFLYTAPVGSFEAGRSPYGLYDTAGNAAEWVFDWYDEFYYREGQVTLPKGPEKGVARVVRGGSWNDPKGDARTTKRMAIAPSRSEAIIGFRCAVDLPEEN